MYTSTLIAGCEAIFEFLQYKFRTFQNIFMTESRLTAVVGFVGSIAAIVNSVTVVERCHHTFATTRTVQLVLAATR